MGDIARTQGQIEPSKAATDKMKDVTPEQIQAAKEDWSKTNPGKMPTADDISGQAYQNFYNQAFTDSGCGTGGKVQQAIQAAIAAVQGLAGGDITKALAGASAPYLATVVKNTVGEDNQAANLMAHAAINAALALAKGDNAAVGAAGAAIGEAMGMIAKSYYGKPVKMKPSNIPGGLVNTGASLSSESGYTKSRGDLKYRASLLSDLYYDFILNSSVNVLTEINTPSLVLHCQAKKCL